MKGLKTIGKIIIFMVIVMMIPLSCIADGDTSSNNTIRLGIDKFRGKDSDNTYPSYALTNQYLYKLYRINDNNKKDYDAPVYCVDAVRGVNTGGSITNYEKTYNTKYNMLNNDLRDDIIADKMVKDGITSGITSDNYDKIIRLLKNIYIIGSTDKKTFLDNMLDKTGTIRSSNQNQYQTNNDYYYVTDKDIELAQQLAIWHYTNPNNNPFNIYLGDDLQIGNLLIALYSDEQLSNISEIITDLKDENNQPLINDVTNQKLGNLNETKKYYELEDISEKYRTQHHTGQLFDLPEQVKDEYLGMWNRAIAIQKIYKKLLAKAEDISISVDNPGKPIEMSNITPAIDQETNPDKFIVGPFKIQKNNNEEYRLNEIKLENNFGNPLENYRLLNNNKELISNKELKDLIGQQFYVELNKNTNVREISFSFKAEYDVTAYNYWTQLNDTTYQPAVEVKRTSEPLKGETSIKIPEVQLDKKVTKIWKGDTEENRPTSIQVELKRNDDIDIQNSIKQLDNTNNWEATWENLPKYDSRGNEIEYTIEELNVPEGYTPKTKNEGDDIVLTNTKKEAIFDLALRKFIVDIDGIPQDREPTITSKEVIDLKNGQATYDFGTTAKKVHSKSAPVVQKGSKIVYTIRVYNEGQVAGTANKVVDYLPAGLSLAPDSRINIDNGWGTPDANGKVETSILEGETINPPKKGTEGSSTDKTEIYFKDIQIECIVNENATNSNLKNIAEITEYSSDNDVDSDPENININNYKPKDSANGLGEEDDDDYENLVLKEYDFSLRKFISAVGSRKTIDREPNVITTNLIPNGNEETAIYKGSKNPVGVNIGDIVTYTIRVYNEGEQDGYIGEISDYLPEELDFIGAESLENADDITSAIDNLEAVIDGNTDSLTPEKREESDAIAFNAGYGWQYDKQARRIYTNILSKNPNTSSDPTAPDYTTFQNIIINEENTKARRGENSTALLKAFDGIKLDYLDVQVKCRVNSKAKSGETITNIAEISEYEDINGSSIVEDRDSQPANFPDDKKNNEYEGNGEIDGYYPGQQDDDDFEKIVIQQFDLALRKFISNVDGKDITDRAPIPDVSKLNTKDEKGNLITYVEYNHVKTPVTVVKGSVITYTISVYNEGDVDGYATEITDYLPPELEYVKDSEINEQYKWDISKDGRTLTTDYLSYTKGDKNLIKAYDGNTLDHKEVQIQCRVKDTAKYERNITNLAQITDDSDANGNDVEDRDSHPNDKFELPDDKDLPKYKEDESSKLFVPGQEEDDDFEKVNVVYFDLALRKIVSKAIIIEGSSETVTETNHKFEDDPEEIVKVDLGKRKLNAVTVKFEYQIRITNEGLIEGYAKEIKDYIPEGLIFKAEDNPLWKEIQSGIITTDQLKDTLLKPGESKIISIILTWKNGQDNLGLKTNIAEISKDYNKFNTPDVDSTPDNKKDGEDDIDIAPVMLSIALGNAKTYFGLSILMLSTAAIGIVLIKKIVL